MFRITVLSVVLAFAVGQNAALLCQPWCVPHEAARSGCHDTGSTDAPRLANDNHCDDTPPSSVAFLKEDGRRTASSSHTDQAIAIPRYQFVPSTIDGDPEPGHLPSLEKRPLVTALRI